MTFRATNAADVPAIAAFLRGYVEPTLFALSNLINSGLGRDLLLQLRFVIISQPQEIAA